jgi:hypothetical protein
MQELQLEISAKLHEDFDQYLIEAEGYTPLDGYSYLERIAKAGFVARPEFGDWPYNIIAMKFIHDSKTQRVVEVQIIEYIEHTVKRWNMPYSKMIKFNSLMREYKNLSELEN